MKYFLVLASLAIALVLILESMYFRGYRQDQNTDVVSEHFIRDGRLGKILLKNEMISIAPDSHKLAIQDECADSGDLGYGDFQNQFKVRAHVTSPNPTILVITVAVGPRGKQTYYRKEHITEPGRQWYTTNFKARKGQEIYVKFAIQPDTSATLFEADIQARFSDLKQPIVQNGKPVDALFRSINIRNDFTPPSGPGTTMQGKVPEITMHIPQGINADLYAGNYPEKNAGFCNYIATQFNPGQKSLNKQENSYLLPRVKITAMEEDLRGDSGILDNKQRKGRWWEKPAKLSVRNQASISNQKVGLRFHGGGPGRQKNIESYRVYARKRFGLPTMSAEAILGTPSKLDLKTIVFKYTYQSLTDRDIDFNPFIHSLALDIGKQVGAIIPRYHLVDLTVNDQHKGLYLALEHLSERTIEHWLGHNEFTTYSYKSRNTNDQAHALLTLVKSILAVRGEETLEILNRHMNINNAINSILLTGYIGDDDYCQGMEVFTRDEGVPKMTSINWDLDHAFFKLDEINNEPFIDPQKYAFRPIANFKRQCTRQWIYGWTYIQSAEFRRLIRKRMETVLNTTLKAENAVHLLDQYRAINEQEFQGRYNMALNELETYLRLRPDILRKQLAELEKQAEEIDAASIEDWL